jgi:hypothetical protein
VREAQLDTAEIFIASSGRTLVLAEMLRDALNTSFSHATLWSDHSKLTPGDTIIEMLEEAAKQYDFAVIILARDDVTIGGSGETLKARDNCVFEAGLFMSAIGRKRCFLVTSVDKEGMPSDLGGIIRIPFDEPSDLVNRAACSKAVEQVAAALKTIVQRDGPAPSHENVPLISSEEVFRRERIRDDGGDLDGGQVVVVDHQPSTAIGRAELIRKNLDDGVSYFYFLLFNEDTVEKICLSLQIVAWLGVNKSGAQSDFQTRIDALSRSKADVVDYLSGLCRNGQLRLSLMLQPPSVRFRVHNASHYKLAKLYANYHDNGYVLWNEAEEASNLWKSLPTYLEDDNADRLLLPLKQPAFDDERRRTLGRWADRSLARFFPGMAPEIKAILLGANHQ